MGYKGHKGKKTIILMEEQKRVRVRWCQQFVGDSLNNIIWTNKKPFELYKHCHLVYTKTGQVVQPRPVVKYPLKIQIWEQSVTVERVSSSCVGREEGTQQTTSTRWSMQHYLSNGGSIHTTTGSFMTPIQHTPQRRQLLG